MAQHTDENLQESQSKPPERKHRAVKLSCAAHFFKDFPTNSDGAIISNRLSTGRNTSKSTTSDHRWVSTAGNMNESTTSNQQWAKSAAAIETWAQPATRGEVARLKYETTIQLKMSRQDNDWQTVRCSSRGDLDYITNLTEHIQYTGNEVSNAGWAKRRLVEAEGEGILLFGRIFHKYSQDKFHRNKQLIRAY